jgi:ribonucleoside-triphosphate reductase|nr:MAG TPA: anaerobic ribonucleoside triphosphate reductase [Caudoviricetes sp.]
MIEKYEKYRHNVDFIRDYSQASNAATGSKFDSNANIETKNVTTLSCEIHKEADIGINRLRMIDKITELYGTELAEKYIEQLDSHQIYRHDETHPVFPYCVSITMYPFICEGLKSIGAPSTEPKNLQSFAGNFINLVFAVSAQFAGAVATPEFLTYLDHFIRLEYGDDYYEKTDIIVNTISKRPKTLEKVIDDIFEQIVYSINEPAAARNFQSVFWNIAYFDHTYFNAIFEDFVFPDGDEPKWDSVSWLQKHFMEWFNNERLRNYLTFPVETVNLVYDKESKQYIDKEWADFTAEMWSKGHSFFCYNSDSADSLSSCCRLKNGITDNVFSYTLGAGGISTGSKAVITININRLVQDVKKKSDKNNLDFNIELDKAIRSQVDDIHKYLNAFNEILKDEQSSGLLPIYDAGYISLPKQYLTIGINGLVEGAEFLGIKVAPNPEYFNYCKSILAPIQEENKKARTNEIMFNTEYVPAENLGVKNAEWDRKAGYYVPRDCYNSYFFKVEDQELSVLDKMILHGQQVVQYLDGGSACHLNLEEHLDKNQYRTLLDVAAKIGCSYLTFNIPNTICNECGHISKHKQNKCEKCRSTDLDYITRVIGYAKRVSKYSEARQKEARRRVYNATRNVFTRN